MTTCRLAALIIIVSFSYLTSATAEQASADLSDVLKTLDKSHPRLMLKNKGLERLKELYTEDKVLQKCVKDVIDEADDCADKSMLMYLSLIHI